MLPLYEDVLSAMTHLSQNRWRKRNPSYTRWFKYDRDYSCVNKSQFVPVIFERPCSLESLLMCPKMRSHAGMAKQMRGRRLARSASLLP